MNENGTVSFELTQEQKMIQELARDFARNEIAPVAEHYDKSHEYPWPVVKKAQEIGLTAMSVPEEYGGLGLSLFEEVLVGEELSWGCSGISTAIAVNGLALAPRGGDARNGDRDFACRSRLPGRIRHGTHRL